MMHGDTEDCIFAFSFDAKYPNRDMVCSIPSDIIKYEHNNKPLPRRAYPNRCSRQFSSDQ